MSFSHLSTVEQVGARAALPAGRPGLAAAARALRARALQQ